MTGISPADCPHPDVHGTPFRYCPYCSWTESIEVGRHPDTVHLLSLFEYAHLPAHLQGISRPTSALAHELTSKLADGPELTAGLRKLLEAKDCFVRQAVIDHRSGASE